MDDDPKKMHRFFGGNFVAAHRPICTSAASKADSGLHSGRRSHDENRTSIINYVHLPTPLADTVKLVVYCANASPANVFRF